MPVTVAAQETEEVLSFGGGHEARPLARVASLRLGPGGFSGGVVAELVVEDGGLDDAGGMLALP